MRAQRFDAGGPRLWLVGACFVALTLTYGKAVAESGAEPLGATAESLLAAGRRLSPELRAAALETAAASAQADAAGALEDPVFQFTADESDRERGPRKNKLDFSLSQQVPLWGKRGLQHAASLAAVDAAKGREEVARAELDQRIKVAFARYYAAVQAIGISRQIRQLAREIMDVATLRYGQGLGEQGDAILAMTEATWVETEAARLEAERDTAVAQINGLLARPAGAPLATPTRLRPLPEREPAIEVLLDRVHANNPTLFAARAEVRSATAERELAHKAWYPDPTFGVTVIQRDFGPTGYTGSVAFALPLQWGVKRAGERATAARLDAARQKLAASEAQIQGELEGALASLRGARRTEELLRAEQLPNYQTAYRSMLASYGQNRGSLALLLQTENRLRDTQLELLRAQTDAQTALAAIERLIGGEL